MNKFLIILLAITLSGCAKSHMQVYLEYEDSRQIAGNNCAATVKTFVKYWKCYLDWNKQWARAALNNGDIDFDRYQSFEFNRKLQHNGMFPLAEALDAKKITYDDYLKGMNKVNDLITQAIAYQQQVRAAKEAAQRIEAERRRQATLNALATYAITMRALYPQQTYQPIIINK